ncbi:MAG: AAA family ATPase [Elusimicrobiota bacterium]|jgi:ATP-dependent Clp protease ATP-binding subunit ClpC
MKPYFLKIRAEIPRAVSIIMCAALIWTCPGLGALQAAAQTVKLPAADVMVIPLAVPGTFGNGAMSGAPMQGVKIMPESSFFERSSILPIQRVDVKAPGVLPQGFVPREGSPTLLAPAVEAPAASADAKALIFAKTRGAASVRRLQAFVNSLPSILRADLSTAKTAAGALFDAVKDAQPEPLPGDLTPGAVSGDAPEASSYDARDARILYMDLSNRVKPGSPVMLAAQSAAVSAGWGRDKLRRMLAILAGEGRLAALRSGDFLLLDLSEGKVERSGKEVFDGRSVRAEVRKGIAGMAAGAKGALSAMLFFAGAREDYERYREIFGEQHPDQEQAEILFNAAALNALMDLSAAHVEGLPAGSKERELFQSLRSQIQDAYEDLGHAPARFSRGAVESFQGMLTALAKNEDSASSEGRYRLEAYGALMVLLQEHAAGEAGSHKTGRRVRLHNGAKMIVEIQSLGNLRVPGAVNLHFDDETANSLLIHVAILLNENGKNAHLQAFYRAEQAVGMLERYRGLFGRAHPNEGQASALRGNAALWVISDLLSFFEKGLAGRPLGETGVVQTRDQMSRLREYLNGASYSVGAAPQPPSKDVLTSMVQLLDAAKPGQGAGSLEARRSFEHLREFAISELGHADEAFLQPEDPSAFVDDDDLIVGEEGSFAPIPEKKAPPIVPAGTDKGYPKLGLSEFPNLNKFGVDLTALAAAGRLNPLIGRDQEIRQMVKVLGRVEKNNPVVTGEKGVGKTKIVEGLAQRIAAGEIPSLYGKSIVKLDLGAMLAGTTLRGQFEQRMKDVLREAKNSHGRVILFIDELHTILGLGNSEGSTDAASMLKEALVGEVSVIGATTLSEYRKIEADGALARRFQEVRLDAPSEQEAVDILSGVKFRYEDKHGVSIPAETVREIVRLAARYLKDRSLPDSALDLMDDAAGEVQLQVEESGRSGKESRKKEVLPADAAFEVFLRTGIPVQELSKDDKAMLGRLDEDLKKAVIGQDAAVESVVRAVRRARMGYKDPKQPIGVFAFLGPTGVGKTELARSLARFLFQSEASMTRLDMSEYMEKQNVSRLISAPPGYVGYEDGGQLTEPVRRNPYQVILLDEVEKAHPDVLKIFLQVLEDGRMTDGQGHVVDFSNTIILMTSNLGGSISQPGPMSTPPVGELRHQRYLDAFKKAVPPEFFNRIGADNVLVFSDLDRAGYEKILDLRLADFSKILGLKRMTASLTEAARKRIIDEASSDANRIYGARPLKQMIERQVYDAFVDAELEGRIQEGDSVEVDFAEGKFLARKASGAVKLGAWAAALPLTLSAAFLPTAAAVAVGVLVWLSVAAFFIWNSMHERTGEAPTSISWAYRAKKGLAALLAGLGLAVSSPRLPQADQGALIKSFRAHPPALVILDYDKTFMDNPDGIGSPVSDERVELLRRLKAAGVRIAFASNRPLTGGGWGLSSLLMDRLPPDVRAGMILSTDGGAELYQYGAGGERPRGPVLSRPADKGPEALRIEALLKEHARALKMTDEDWYDDQKVLRLYEAFSPAFLAAGYPLDYRVVLSYPAQGRGAPEIWVARADKGGGAREIFWLAQKQKLISRKDILIFGDDFGPRGQDAAMARALPRATALAVGESADPRLSNVHLLADSGPESTTRFLQGLLPDRSALLDDADLRDALAPVSQAVPGRSEAFQFQAYHGGHVGPAAKAEPVVSTARLSPGAEARLSLARALAAAAAAYLLHGAAVMFLPSIFGIVPAAAFWALSPGVFVLPMALYARWRLFLRDSPRLGGVKLALDVLIGAYLGALLALAPALMGTTLSSLAITAGGPATAAGQAFIGQGAPGILGSAAAWLAGKLPRMLMGVSAAGSLTPAGLAALTAVPAMATLAFFLGAVIRSAESGKPFQMPGMRFPEYSWALFGAIFALATGYSPAGIIPMVIAWVLFGRTRVFDALFTVAALWSAATGFAAPVTFAVLTLLPHRSAVWMERLLGRLLPAGNPAPSTRPEPAKQPVQHAPTVRTEHHYWFKTVLALGGLGAFGALLSATVFGWTAFLAHLGAASALIGLQVYFSPKLIMKMMKAGPLSEEDAPEVFQVVRELRGIINKGLEAKGRKPIPMPEIIEAPMDVPNAFAAGLSPSKAVVGVTPEIERMLLDPEGLRNGLLRLIDQSDPSGIPFDAFRSAISDSIRGVSRQTGSAALRAAVAEAAPSELKALGVRVLRGILGHELSHVMNRDMVIGAVSESLTAAVALSASWVLWILGSIESGWARLTGNKAHRSSAVKHPKISAGVKPESVEPVSAAAAFGVLKVFAALWAPIMAQLLQMGSSRIREGGADEDGALLTRDPDALALGLGLLTAWQPQNFELRAEELPLIAARSPWMTVDPFEQLRGAGWKLEFDRLSRWVVGPGDDIFFRLFVTHPDTIQRIERLHSMH